MATSHSSYVVVFYSTYTNTSCSFFSFTKLAKFDCQSNMSCIVSVLYCATEPKFYQLTLVFSAFCRFFLKITSFHTTFIGQILLCHVTEVKMLRFFIYCIRTLLVSDQPTFQEFYLNTLQSRNVGVKSVGTKIDI